ncbi:sensor histidine kinase [Microbacterium sp. P04]|uniref:sensor histidine kinase n=1 Tax=Microbacterium sp. P04 TaxID=3366947 RepID=UPI00374643C3
MPLFEESKTPRGRLRVWARAQLPFFTSTIVMAIGLAIVEPGLVVEPPLLTAWALVLIATLAGIIIPWERFPAKALIIVALIDVGAVALIPVEALTHVPAVTTLVMFPVLWLAYGFGRLGIICAILGTGVITSLPYVLLGRLPAGGEWVNIVMLPLLVSAIALVVYIAAQKLAESSRGVRAASARLELARQEAEDRAVLLRSILDTMDAGVGFFDTSKKLALTNTAARGIADRLGVEVDQSPYAGEHVLGADRATPVAPERRVVTRALEGEEISNEVEWIGPPDVQMAVAASARPVTRGDGEAIGTLIIMNDVTELALAVELREEFLKTVSHELRTPVTNIAGYAELIGDALGEEHPELRRSLEAVQRNVDRLTTRLRELLAATDTTESLHLGEVDAREVVTEAVAAARTQLPDGGVTLEVLDLPNAPILAEPAFLREAVRELIANALKHGPATGAVTIGLDADDDRVRIWVSDTGHGISLAERTRVFDRFYRTDKARRGAIQGFGLGLTQVQNVVHAHHGSVLIDSSATAGTRFTIDLPAATVAEASALTPAT